MSPSPTPPVARWKHRFQEFLLAPVRDRLHPLSLRLFGELCGQEQRL